VAQADLPMFACDAAPSLAEVSRRFSELEIVEVGLSHDLEFVGQARGLRRTIQTRF
jgi:hypothetical protein